MSKDKDIALFVAFCIEEYGAAKGMTGGQVLDLFSQYGVTSYLSKCYEPLHTQGRQWLMDEIDEFIAIRKNKVVEHPMILRPNRKLDYGEGFYTTTSWEQSKEWVERRMLEQQSRCGYVNVYEFDNERMPEFKSLIFSEPGKEWAEFVMANRTQKEFTHDYDIVYGPVANDRVYLQFGLYEAGAISIETLIRELKTYKLVDQYLFHTEKALTSLHFVEAVKIEK